MSLDLAVLAAGLLAVASPCALSASGPVPEGAACALGSRGERAEEPAPPGPVVIAVMSQHCPACQQMEPVVARAERACATRVTRAFIEEADGVALAVRHRVVGVPTFLVLDGEGREIDRLVGTQSLASVRHALSRVSSRPCQ